VSERAEGALVEGAEPVVIPARLDDADLHNVRTY
jgi:hypothetical protein